MRKTALVILVLFVMVSASYGGSTFDSTNDTTIGVSLQKMMMGLSPADQLKLKQAIAAIYMAEAVSAMGKDTAYIKKTAGKKLHGKNAKEIIDMAEKAKLKLPKTN